MRSSFSMRSGVLKKNETNLFKSTGTTSLQQTLEKQPDFDYFEKLGQSKTTASSLSQRIAKRLDPEQLRRVRRHEFSPCKHLRFFMQYDDNVKQKLLAVAIPKFEVPPNTVLFSQGDQKDGYYVIARGTVKIEQKAARYMNRKDMPPVVVRTCYDGDTFGEMVYFTATQKPSSKPQQQQRHQDEKDFLRLHDTVKRSIDNESASMFNKQRYYSEKEMRDLDPEDLAKLNQQRTTATTMEWCDLLYIDKKQSMEIIKAGTHDENFKEREKFLRKIPLFQKINTTHLQPLISNLVVKKYRKGEYIQREGEEPPGLMILRRGHAICVADKLSFRLVNQKAQQYIREEYETEEMQKLLQHPKILKDTNKKRIYQNNRIYFDCNDEQGGNPNMVPPDYVVYKDLMVFKKISAPPEEDDQYYKRCRPMKCYFGGRALIAENNMKNVKRQIQREKGLVYQQGVNAQTFVESRLQHQRDKAATQLSGGIGPQQSLNSTARSNTALSSIATPLSMTSKVNRNLQSSLSNSNYPSSFNHTAIKGTAKAPFELAAADIETQPLRSGRSSILKNPSMLPKVQEFDIVTPRRSINVQHQPPHFTAAPQSQPDFTAAQTAQELLAQQKTDLKSLLSVVADSAVCEVWIIDQDVLGLLPQEVQSKIIQRLREEQKVKVHEEEMSKRPKEVELKRIQDIQKKTIKMNAMKQFEYPCSARVNVKNQKVIQKYRESMQAKSVRHLRSKRKTPQEGLEELEKKLITNIEEVLEREMKAFPNNNQLEGSLKLANIGMPMKQRKIHLTSGKFSCPHKDCTVCITQSEKMSCRALEHCTPDDDRMVDLENLQERHERDQQERMRLRSNADLEALQRTKKKVRREEYGEIDRPEPAEVIADIKEKFVDWDVYKISTMQKMMRTQQRKNHF